MKRAIVFPGGGAGNHLRWLLYLDKSIDGDKTIAEKIDFITNNVYSNERSFNNWLRYESIWRYDDHYESFIKILHEPKDDKPKCKSVFLTYNNWDIVHEHYSLLTSFFLSEELYNNYLGFLESFDDRIKVNIDSSSPNKLIIESDIFFEEDLDETFYKTVVDFFNFEDHYKEACVIHKKWCDNRNRVKKEAYDFFNSSFWKNRINSLNPLGRNILRNKGLLP